MSFTRSIVGAAAVALIATLPTVASAQSRARTACKDGSTTTSMSTNACDNHGGMDRGRTETLRRTPGAETRRDAGPVTQAGSPAPAPANKPRYEEERRGWRWHRHHDEPKPVERRERRYRCRDGKHETFHGNERDKDVCRHHGGIAQ
jgi:hypothetical protein